jgi:hypothetical protein
MLAITVLVVSIIILTGLVLIIGGEKAGWDGVAWHGAV